LGRISGKTPKNASEKAPFDGNWRKFHPLGRQIYLARGTDNLLAAAVRRIYSVSETPGFHDSVSSVARILKILATEWFI
jgi:hypothetical protein